MATKINQVDKLVPVAVSVVMLAAITGVGALVLNEFQDQTYESIDVENETQNSGGSIFDIITVDENANGIKSDNGVRLHDSFDGETLTVPTSNYSVDRDKGEYNFTDNDPDADGSVEINSTNDEYWINYTGTQQTNATQATDRGIGAMGDIAGWISTIVIIVVAGIIFLMLGMVRKAGNVTGRA